jgi:hypothetical protein
MSKKEYPLSDKKNEELLEIKSIFSVYFFFRDHIRVRSEQHGYVLAVMCHES